MVQAAGEEPDDDPGKEEEAEQQEQAVAPGPVGADLVGGGPFHLEVVAPTAAHRWRRGVALPGSVGGAAARTHDRGLGVLKAAFPAVHHPGNGHAEIIAEP